MMDHVLHLRCLVCGRTYAPEEVQYVCPQHGSEGILDVCYDYDRIRSRINRRSLAANHDLSMWRYRPLLPLAEHLAVPPLAIGWSPLHRVPRLATRLGLAHLRLKDEGRLPTGSLKDRASGLAVLKAQEQRARIITTASTGNAAAALAGICASLGRQNVIFVPEAAPRAKIAQLLVYNSTVMLVQGSYDDAFELCLAAAAEFGWYNRNTGYNPYMTEGKKTVAYEICEQLGWLVPDIILVAVGDGCIIGSLHKGLQDLLALGWIDRLPRLVGIQAKGSNFLYQAWVSDEDVLAKEPILPDTVADSISAGLPRDRLKAMAAVRETGGSFIQVSDQEILAAIPLLARTTGIFAEPAGAASLAGLIRALEDGLVDANERIVVLNTGNGLKDIKGTMTSLEMAGIGPHRIEPDLEAVRKKLGV